MSAFGPETLVSRDRSDSPVPRQPAHLHIQRLNVVLTYGIPPEFLRYKCRCPLATRFDKYLCTTNYTSKFLVASSCACSILQYWLWGAVRARTVARCATPLILLRIHRILCHTWYLLSLVELAKVRLNFSGWVIGSLDRRNPR